MIHYKYELSSLKIDTKLTQLELYNASKLLNFRAYEKINFSLNYLI